MIEEAKRVMSKDEQLAVVWNEGLNAMFAKANEMGLNLDFFEASSMLGKGFYAFVKQAAEETLGEEKMKAIADSSIPNFMSKRAVETFNILLEKCSAIRKTPGIDSFDALLLVSATNYTLLEIFNNSFEDAQEID